MTVVFGACRAAAATLAGGQTITCAALGGATPKAALLFITRAAVDATPTPGAQFAMAATTETDRWSYSTRARDNDASATWLRRRANKYLGAPYAGTPLPWFEVIALADGDASEAVCRFDGFVAGGLRLDWTTPPPAGWVILAVFFAGATLQAKAGALGSISTTPQAVTDVGFQPDVVFSGANNVAMNGLAGGFANTTFGVAVRDGATTQFVVSTVASEGSGTRRNVVDLGTRWSEQLSANGLYDYRVTLGAFDAQGFTVTGSASGGSDEIGYLALALGGTRYKLIQDQLPSATGLYSITGIGFAPALVLMGAVPAAFADNSSFKSSLMLSAFSPSEQGALGISREDGVATSNTDSFTDARAVALYQPGRADILATLVGMTADGWRLDYTSVDSVGRVAFALALEGTAAAGPAPTRRARPVVIATG